MISILMSTHNPIKEYFKKSLDSIFNQTYQDFELVLVDDGSSFSVMDYLKEIKCNLDKINYIKLENNVGLPKALNIGIKNCNGEFIARMDDDDIMEKDRLEKQLSYVKSNKVDGCFSWYSAIDKKDNIIYKKEIKISKKKYIKQLLEKGNIFCHSSLFVKKDVLIDIGGYDENLRYAQDSDLYIKILKKYQMGMVNEFLIQHRINDYRNNSYRETLSLTYALFGAMNYYTEKRKLSFKEKIVVLFRILRYYIGIIRISKKGK